MSKRPTDHDMPPAKKRGSERQLTKDDESEEEEAELGDFNRASEEVLKARRIVRARRGSETAATPAATPNPFSGIQLIPAPAAATIPAAASAPPAALPAGQPAAQVRAAQQEETLATPTTSVPDTTAATAAASSNAAAAPASTAAAGIESTAAAAAAPSSAPAASLAAQAAPSDERPANSAAEATSAAAPAASSFAAFAASNASGFASLTAASSSSAFAFGSGAGGLGNGKGFGFGGSSLTAGAFGTGASATSEAAGAASAAPAAPFSFSMGGSPPTFAFPALPATAPGAFSGLFGAAAPATAPLFGSAGVGGGAAAPPRPASAALPEAAPAVTGEEGERAAFAGEGVLFEFDDGRQWRERGRGEMRVNVGPSGRGRLVMRQRGNLRLLLNANLWADMKVTPMDGGKGVTFACINAVKGPDEGEKKEAEAAALEPKLATFAFRIKAPPILEEFVEAVNEHKRGGSPQVNGKQAP